MIFKLIVIFPAPLSAFFSFFLLDLICFINTFVKRSLFLQWGNTCVLLSLPSLLCLFLSVCVVTVWTSLSLRRVFPLWQSAQTWAWGLRKSLNHSLSPPVCLLVLQRRIVLLRSYSFTAQETLGSLQLCFHYISSLFEMFFFRGNKKRYKWGSHWQCWGGNALQVTRVT